MLCPACVRAFVLFRSLSLRAMPCRMAHGMLAGSAGGRLDAISIGMPTMPVALECSSPGILEERRCRIAGYNGVRHGLVLLVFFIGSRGSSHRSVVNGGGRPCSRIIGCGCLFVGRNEHTQYLQVPRGWAQPFRYACALVAPVLRATSPSIALVETRGDGATCHP